MVMPVGAGLLSESRQWGIVENIHVNSYITLPISATPFAVVANDIASGGDVLVLSTYKYQNGKFAIFGKRTTSVDTVLWAHWIAICK